MKRFLGRFLRASGCVRVLSPWLALVLAASRSRPRREFPWENAVNVLAAGVHQHDRSWALACRHRRLRSDLRLWRRRLKTSPRRRPLRRGHGDRRSELPRVALPRSLTRGGTRREHRSEANQADSSLAVAAANDPRRGAETLLLRHVPRRGDLQPSRQPARGMLIFLLLYFFARWATDRSPDSAVVARCGEGSHSIRPDEVQPDFVRRDPCLDLSGFSRTTEKPAHSMSSSTSMGSSARMSS